MFLLFETTLHGCWRRILCRENSTKVRLISNWPWCLKGEIAFVNTYLHVENISRKARLQRNDLREQRNPCHPRHKTHSLTSSSCLNIVDNRLSNSIYIKARYKVIYESKAQGMYEQNQSKTSMARDYDKYYLLGRSYPRSNLTIQCAVRHRSSPSRWTDAFTSHNPDFVAGVFWSSDYGSPHERPNWWYHQQWGLHCGIRVTMTLGMVDDFNLEWSILDGSWPFVAVDQSRPLLKTDSGAVLCFGGPHVA